MNDGISMFALPRELAELGNAAAALARTEFSALAGAAPPGRVNRALVRRLGEHGLLERVIGGSGTRPSSVLELCVLRESLALHSAEAETALALQGLAGTPLIRRASPGVAERWRGPLVSGEAIAAFALSEPDGGSDVAALRTSASREGGGYLLTGVKTWISNAPDADVYVVFARTGGPGAHGITAFAVSAGAEGLSGEPLEMLSPHPIGTLSFDRVFVPDEDVIGEVGGGFEVAMSTLNAFRPSVGAFAVGMGQAALDLAVSYTSSRQAFGRSLSQRQAVSHRLADVATRLEAARLLVYRAAAIADWRGAPDPKLSAMAKLFATEVAQEAVDAAIQVCGAVALQRDHRLAHLYRDVRAPRIYEGASEIQREVIARKLYVTARADDEG